MEGVQASLSLGDLELDPEKLALMDGRLIAGSIINSSRSWYFFNFYIYAFFFH